MGIVCVLAVTPRCIRNDSGGVGLCHKAAVNLCFSNVLLLSLSTDCSIIGGSAYNK